MATTLQLDHHSQAPLSEDILAITRFKNLKLFMLLKDRGMTAADLANQSMTHYVTVLGYLSLKKSPFLVSGSYSECAERIAGVFSVDPEELFPKRLYSLPLPSTVLRAYHSADILTLIEAKQQLIESHELNLDSERLASELIESVDCVDCSPMNKEWFFHYWGIGGREQMTLQEISDRFSVSRSAVDQAINRVMRKLRSPKIGRPLKKFLPCFDVSRQEDRAWLNHREMLKPLRRKWRRTFKQLTNDERKEILLFVRRHSYSEAAEAFNVSSGTVYKIRSDAGETCG